MNPSMREQLESLVEDDKIETIEPLENKAEETQVEEQPTQEEIDEFLEKPNDWSKDYEEHWKTLPKDIRGYLRKRSEEAHKAFTTKATELDVVKKKYSWVDEVVGPLTNKLNSANIKPQDYFANLRKADALLETNPYAGILAISELYQIDLDEFARQRVESDPNYRQLYDNYQKLQAKTFVDQYQSQESELYNQSTKNLELVESFGGEVEFWNDSVQRAMLPLVSDELANGNKDPMSALKAAYEKAVWLVPEIREELVKRQQEAVFKDRQAEVAKAALNSDKTPETPTGSKKAANSGSEGRQRLNALVDEMFST